MAMGSNTYGKDGIRFVRVGREGDRQTVTELTVDLRIEGDFEEAFLKGDGSRVAPVEALRGAVHEVAGEGPVSAPEALGLRLARHLSATVPAVRSAWVRLVEQPWEPILLEGRASPTAFLHSGRGHRTATVNAMIDNISVLGGLSDLLLLQTDTQADPGADPLLATALGAEWRYAELGVDWNASTEMVRHALLETFATHRGPSPHHRLHSMGEAVLAACPQIEDITLSMPVRRHVPITKPDHDGRGTGVFTVADRAFGVVQGTVNRG